MTARRPAATALGSPWARTARVALTCAALLLGIGRSAAADDEPPMSGTPQAATQPDASKHGWSPVSFELDSGLRLAHESNLYHVQRRREVDFATEQDRFERYYGMEGPGDWGARLTFDLSWRWKHASERAIKIRLRSRQQLWRDNEIANHAHFELASTFNVSKADSLTLGIDYDPQHFRKNYAHEAFPGISVFERADVREFGWSLKHEREWSRVWKTSAEVAWGQRDYAEPFDGRDQQRRSWSANARRRLGKRLAVEVGVAAWRARTPESLELGVVKDRSYDDRLASLEVEIKPQHGWRLVPAAQYRVREFVTTVRADTARFGRKDRRWELGLSAGKRIKGGWTLSFDGAWMHNKSGRMVPDNEVEDVSYRDVVLGVAIGYKM